MEISIGKEYGRYVSDLTFGHGLDRARSHNLNRYPSGRFAVTDRAIHSAGVCTWQGAGLWRLSIFSEEWWSWNSRSIESCGR